MASRFWVGGTGNWDAATTTHWSDTSGGAGGFSVPVSTDDVFVDGSSGGGTITLTATGNCSNLDFTGFAGTFAGGSTLNISGSLSLSAAMTYNHTGTKNFLATSGTKTITSNGHSLGLVRLNGLGGTFQLIDAFKVSTFIRQAGTFDPNGQLVTLYGLEAQTQGTFTFYDLTVDNTVNTYLCDNNITVTNNFTCNGISQTDRKFIRTDGNNFPRRPGSVTVTITAANVSISNVDFQDIVGAGVGSWTGTSLGDAGGNSGITFTTPVTRYWVGNGGNYSSTTHWSASTGGASGATMPLCHDTVFFDSNSISSGSQTIVCDVKSLGKDVDFTGILNSPELRFDSPTNDPTMVFGSLTMGSGMTTSTAISSGGVAFHNRTAKVFTPSGVTFDCVVFSSGPGTSMTQVGDLTITGIALSNLSFAQNQGTYNINNYNITTPYFDLPSSPVNRTLNMGSGIITLTGINAAGNGVWQIFTTSGLTLNAGTSKIVINDTSASAKTFTGAGLTYYDIEFTGDNILITGSNTFHDMKVNNAGMTNGLKITTGTTQTLNGTFTDNGSVGNLCVVKSSTATAATLSKSSGKVCCNYLDLTNVHATGGATWKAGANSVDNGNNTGWQFVSCPANNVSGQFFLCL